MGLEASCRVRWGGQVSNGKALLETDELVFRGDFRLKIRLRDIQSLEARAGELCVRSTEGTAVFELGPAAEKWALRIQHPKSLLDKLGVKENARVAVWGVTDPAFLHDLSARTSNISKSTPEPETDVIFLGAEELHALDQLAEAQKFLTAGGGVWVVYPKGQKHITESQVLAAIELAGLTDVKVARFSETHTALKAVIPVKQRAVSRRHMIAAGALAAPLRAQSPKFATRKTVERFWGAWILATYEQHKADGGVSYPMGPDAVGRITYDPAGRMSAQLMRRNRPRFASQFRQEGTAEEIRAAFLGYLGYYGPYTLNENDKTIIHHVECASFPNWVAASGSQVRLRWRSPDPARGRTGPLRVPAGVGAGTLTGGQICTYLARNLKNLRIHSFTWFQVTRFAYIFRFIG